MRPVGRADRAFLSEMWRDPQVRRYLGGPVAVDQLEARFASYVKGAVGVGIWVATLSVDGAPLGVIVVHPHHDGMGHEVSFEFVRRVWGQGLAREAVGAVVDHILNDEGLAQILAETQAVNEASCRLFEALGFAQQRRLVRFDVEQIVYSKS
ncbi:GNAT family N-acetyltransferase [Shimia sp. SK013]|uniref:GNAT family N-acetyltransferase n=1 Tax=Shimia sp. SK013 TaxID=1389006 RepID=UPI0023AA20C7|nr:GNAT family N-acetyltransferase [Shimia sp. SK013]